MARHKGNPILGSTYNRVDITESDLNKGKPLVDDTVVAINFDIEVQSTLQKINNLLVIKGKEYRRNDNPFHNFNEGSAITGFIPERVLDGFLLKHMVSYRDMLRDIEQGKTPKIEAVEEKFNDILVYFIIQKSMIIKRINDKK